jgi:hypothetical protein
MVNSTTTSSDFFHLRKSNKGIGNGNGSVASRERKRDIRKSELPNSGSNATKTAYNKFGVHGSSATVSTAPAVAGLSML